MLNRNCCSPLEGWRASKIVASSSPLTERKTLPPLVGWNEMLGMETWPSKGTRRTRYINLALWLFKQKYTYTTPIYQRFNKISDELYTFGCRGLRSLHLGRRSRCSYYWDWRPRTRLRKSAAYLAHNRTTLSSPPETKKDPSLEKLMQLTIPLLLWGGGTNLKQRIGWGNESNHLAVKPKEEALAVREAIAPWSSSLDSLSS